MTMRLLTSLVLIISTFTLLAQSPTQTIRGNIMDATTQSPLIGATINIQSTDYGSSTDTLGDFVIKEMPIGRYAIEVKYLGYESLLIPEVLIESAKETVLDIELQEMSAELSAVVVSATGLNFEALSPLASHVITLEETRRFPATFYDPARMAVAFAGVRNTNDQANGISIRGNSPTTMKWMLEGADIVNPNHTPNAGTVTDRVTPSSGGVNILSSQLLDNSILLKGNFGAQYGNVVGGVMDMRLRKGNDQQREHTLQAGLNGFDVATEGPFSKNSKTSYLVNARYSFTGLLGLMGVDFGGETIAYQDVSANINIPTKNQGDISLFGILGSSQNTFNGDLLDSILVEKDFKNIDFSSNMYALGATWKVASSKKMSAKFTIAYSATESTRNSATYDNIRFPNSIDNYDNIREDKFSFRTNAKTKFNEKSTLHFGASAVFSGYQQQLNFESFVNDRYNLDIDAQHSNSQLYASVEHELTNRIAFNLGAKILSYLISRDTFSSSNLELEPRGNLTYQIDNKSQLTLAFGKHSQMNLPFLYFEKNIEANAVNNDLGVIKAWHFDLAYQRYFNSSLKFNAEAYYQQLANIPGDGRVTAFDIQENFRIPRPGEGWTERLGQTNYGIDLALKKYLTNGHYFQLAANLGSARIDNVARSAWDTPYSVNWIAGKEWEEVVGEKSKSFGIHASTIYAAGQVQLYIADDSQEMGYTAYERRNGQTAGRLPDYFRIDLRLYRKWSKTGRTTSLALDIQNVTNQQNPAYQYYDYLTEQIETKYQLGLIPVLTWRGEF